ncbi:MAG: hypothetical protein BZY88_12610 [SAR202 cluster bacterium Io17-Chloro-G9]|nr:MAG: hypothetical protein BZY88_12610 [SAR202 cluster bacterium Io17-Chloro-G9]
MTSVKKERSLVVIELAGGNDALNTVIPYNNGLYYDFRPTIGIPQDEVLGLNPELGLNPNMAPFKTLWDQGNLAIINGIGYANPNRSHFRSRDVWYTAEPEKIGAEGWLGAVLRDMDPTGENVLTGVNFGRGLPRALVCKGVPVASVGNLETYGLLPDLQDEMMRRVALDAFSRMYGPTPGKDAVAQVLGQAGTDALKGADILRTAPQLYSSDSEYADNPIAQTLKNVAQVMCAGLGTRVYYARHASFDTHSAELLAHSKLWQDVSTAIGDFTTDLTEHGLEKDALILVFSEFGRRIKDNGAGCDHGSGGVAFVIGEPVNGGFYGEFPSLREEDQLDGDLHANNDFRSTYSTILDKWLGLDPVPITNGRFEQFDFVSN